MIFHIFAVHDSKAKAFLPPFLLPEVGMALRTFGDCVNDKRTPDGKRHQFAEHPEDYTLFKIGEFDNIAGMVKKVENESLGSGVQHLEEIIL